MIITYTEENCGDIHRVKTPGAAAGIRPLLPQEAYDLLEIVETRCQRSMIFCTQYQSEGWYARIGPSPDSGSPVCRFLVGEQMMQEPKSP